ncbi:outer membrane beta-barrel protein [Granulicella tundricola]|uniref:Outer membrane protein beta-barrel domain-containing protein n=1 Tax=Granulicella tundricola (strain ATCC BAA-1859 / DSM 23138 / MP5ACTX9) TaxID=1198114 RepID=E8WXS9_GRATM|nr:outer membrane beta-barrel protein [Granulicella tundricola]ADW69774.1 hypothetical protein AciX9_2750 [Granulicella tundricola MP5ACTX9]
MNLRSRSVLVFAALLSFAPTLFAQAAYTATRSSRIQAGVAVMYLNSDYTDDGNKGLLFFGDYDFNRWVGVEADARLGGLISASDIGENSYSIGPRATYRRGRLNVSARSPSAAASSPIRSPRTLAPSTSSGTAVE